MTKGHFGMSHKQQDFYEKNIGEYIMITTGKGNQIIGKLVGYSEGDRSYVRLQPYCGLEYDPELKKVVQRMIDFPSDILKSTIEVRTLTNKKSVENILLCSEQNSENPPQQNPK